MTFTGTKRTLSLLVERVFLGLCRTAKALEVPLRPVSEDHVL